MNFLFPLGAVLIWAVNSIVSKLSVGVITPEAISFYRWMLALLVLTPFVLPGVIRHRTALSREWLKLLILGALGMVLYQSLAYYAARTVSALFIGILIASIPLLTVIFSLFILRLTPTLGIVLGAVISFAGLAWLISDGHPQQLLSQGLGSGELMMIVAAAAYALYGVLTKRWSMDLPRWQSLYIQILFAVLMLLPGFLITPSVALTAKNIPLVLYAAIAASIIAPYLWIQGVMRLGANTASIFLNLAPVFTAVIAITCLHEKMHSWHWIGGSLTLAGVILAQRLRIPVGRRTGNKPR
ncbi:MULTISPECIES: DMT family transporter [Tatumella]|mgnify:CR=1 FL=1|uniref:Threonine/homoserine exporter RhtA n=1 Tax=Tatumella punctata TaxID=399969 RepID=A0ABW1VMB7_9GAMM|nr:MULTISPECIES: DMT family transporter [unclassified Tatumella]MBS0854898.1 DMT family transporter [Tatumella sp. JGM16]MBS0876415.1 DMT family transporter [Tatumella sp. JGM82]MBS0889588.1 DMT family transporter [Tatumella sp. JGM94]MBS0893054.1 DMT family transporter [Tatumella sp. JGM130]MBS0900710.1 DMT family transporter [Tatumella sp. JGM100]